jgi:membrane protein required for colicin V production
VLLLIWVDYGIVGVIGFSALVGMLRGVIREVFALAAWGLAIWVGFRFSRDVSVLLNDWVPLPSLREILAFAVLFLASLIVASWAGFLVSKGLQSVGLSGIDRGAGLLFGVARGMLVVSVLVWLCGMTPLPADSWWRQSRLIPPFQSLGVWLRDQIPPDYSHYLEFSIKSKQ